MARKVMLLGDSITDGDGSSHGAGYRRELREALLAAGQEFEFVGSLGNGVVTDPPHEGHSGWEIADVAGQVAGWLRLWRPDVVLLHLGTNDLDRDVDVAGAPGRLGALVDTILHTLPAPTVFVSSLVRVESEAVQGRVDRFNAAIPELVASRARAGHDVRFVDMSGLLTLADLVDDLHPNDHGYAKIAGAWFTALTTG
jgi:lysophospholipase L1-like esterase